MLTAAQKHRYGVGLILVSSYELREPAQNVSTRRRDLLVET